MPTTNEGVLLFIGAIFFLIGLLGGGFEVAAIKMPPVGRYPRLISGGIGIIFMGIAVSRLIFPPLPPQPTTVPTVLVTPTTLAVAPIETPIPPTYTPVLPTDTPILPTHTSVPIPTDTPTFTPTLKPTPTNIPTPSPTNTPRPTPTPTATIDADLTVYDNFNNPAFDGKWNTGLWTYGGGTNSANTLVKQQDGILMISRELDFRSGLEAARPNTWAVDQIGFVEVKMMLDGTIKASEWGEMFIVIVGTINDSEWWATCYILGEQGKNDAQGGCGTVDYNGNSQAVPFNSWHTLRFEIDPETAVMSFLVDGRQFDKYVHPNPKVFKETKFKVGVGVWSSGGGLVTGYFDDVRIGKSGQ